MEPRPDWEAWRRSNPRPGLPPLFGKAGERLPPELRAKLAAARRDGAGQFKEMHREIRDARGALFQALQEFPPDRRKIDALGDDLNRLQERRQNLILDRILAETKSMSPQERKAFFELLERRFLRPHPGGGDRPPPRYQGRPKFFHHEEERP